MLILLNRVIPYEELKKDNDKVFDMVTAEGEIIIFRNNKPMYVINEFEYKDNPSAYKLIERPDYTLQEAMKVVLKEQKNCTMHAKELAEKIFEKRLYWRKDGQMAKYNQIRARVDHYPHMFEALPGNYIHYFEFDEDK